MNLRNSEPTRPASALERRINEEKESRPLTAPPDLPTSSESSVAKALEPAEESDEDEDEEPDEELLAHVSTTLYELQNNWQAERRTAAATLWQELQSSKPTKTEDELGELEDVAKVRALDESASRDRELAVCDAEEVLMLVDSFRSAMASSGDPEAALEQATILEERRLAKSDARARALEQAWIEKPEAEAAAGPAPDGEECASFERASQELQAARSRRQQFEEQRCSSYSSDASQVEVAEGSRLRGLRQDVQRLKDKEAWAADAEKAAGPQCNSAPSRTASPCRRREPSAAADEGAGFPATGLALDAWVEDLRSFIDCKLLLQDVNEGDGCRHDILEGSCPSSPSSSSKRKEQKSSSVAGGPEAGAGEARYPSRSPAKGGISKSLAGLAQAASPKAAPQGLAGQLWRTTAKQGSWSPKRLPPDSAAEAEAAAGLPQKVETFPATSAIDPLSQLDDILKEFDEIDRIHSNICKLSSRS